MEQHPPKVTQRSDATEQAGLDRDLFKSQRLAAVGELAAAMAHDVRGAAAGMGFALRVLRGMLPDSPAVQECLRDLEGGLQRIGGTVSRVLDFAKARPAPPRPCSLADIIEAARSLTATHLRTSRVELCVELPEGLPELQADPALLERVFVSLILDGCKAMPDGGRLGVRARADAGRPVAEIEIPLEAPDAARPAG